MSNIGQHTRTSAFPPGNPFPGKIRVDSTPPPPLTLFHISEPRTLFFGMRRNRAVLPPPLENRRTRCAQVAAAPLLGWEEPSQAATATPGRFEIPPQPAAPPSNRFRMLSQVAKVSPAPQTAPSQAATMPPRAFTLFSQPAKKTEIRLTHIKTLGS